MKTLPELDRVMLRVLSAINLYSIGRATQKLRRLVEGLIRVVGISGRQGNLAQLLRPQKPASVKTAFLEEHLNLDSRHVLFIVGRRSCRVK